MWWAMRPHVCVYVCECVLGEMREVPEGRVSGYQQAECHHVSDGRSLSYHIYRNGRSKS